jgi:LuxR family transcriptional regulator, maltose regulon positive regulatory protein
MSPDTILKTKLFIPPLREGMISRSRLVELINKGIKKKVLFLSAPAGFGKSTLMVEWVAQAKTPAAWVSLDKTENDPVNFLSYLVSGAQSIYPNIGDAILGALKSPGSPPVENLLHAWINEISEHAGEFVLILDDFHHIQNHDVNNLICNLIDHQPAQLHLVLASRADLPLSCSRFRTRGELTDLGVSDLRFTPDETFTYLNSQLRGRITKVESKTLGDRTEGWIAGLQMAVLSMKSSEDISQYVAQFSAQNRYITDYLLDEVLLRQSEEVKRFLLATSILNKFTAPLCDQVVGIENSQEIIEHIERSGLFTIPLDTTRSCYRYHHLFAELLRKRLEKSPIFKIEDFHRKASNWYAEQGMLEECIDHAFAIKDYDLVIRRIEELLNLIMAQGQFRNYLAWVDKIPKEYLKEKPRLEIVKIYMLHEMGRLDERDKQQKIVDDLLGPLPEEIEKYSSGEIINYGILAAIKTIVFASGYLMIDDARNYYAIANRLLPKNHLLWRAMAAGAIPFLDRVLGNYKRAISSYDEVLELDLQAGFVFQTFIVLSALTKSYLEVGELKRAIITCQKAIDMDIKHGANLPFAKLVYLVMGELMYQSGQLSSAESYIEMGLEHVVRHGDIYSIIDGYSTLARIQIAIGDSEQALSLIREMKTVIGELSPSKNALKIVNAWEAYIMIFASQWGPVKKWVKEPGFDELEGKYLFDLGSHTYVGIYRVSQNPIKIYSDFIKMTSARLHLVLNDLEDGLRIIEEVLIDTMQGGRIKHKIESMVIKSLFLQKMDRNSEAITVFHEAIRLAAREGFIQIFLNEGDVIKELLKMVKENKHGDIEEQVFILRLLENIHQGIIQNSNQLSNDPDQLTRREIEVLKCLTSGLSYSQAAEKLSISRNTLKTHTKRIYQKLGVNGLLQALNKAKELKILN